jgi:hypothetical protein
MNTRRRPATGPSSFTFILSPEESRPFWERIPDAILNHDSQGDYDVAGRDLLFFPGIDEKAPGGMLPGVPAEGRTVQTTLYPMQNGIAFMVDGLAEVLILDPGFETTLLSAIAERNRLIDLVPPPDIEKVIAKDRAIEKSKSSTVLPARLPQPTFIESRATINAISDAKDGKNWSEVGGALALLHRPGKTSHQVRFEPNTLIRSWWSNPSPNVGTLWDELSQLEFDAVVTFQVTLAMILHDPKARWTVAIDDIIKLIGRDTDARRSAKSRHEWRYKIWRWLVVFDSWAIVGARPGRRWREPAARGEKRAIIPTEKLMSRDPLIRIVGQQGADQGSFDNSEPPKEVSIVPGEWLMQFHGNREILADFGDVLSIASIARGKPSGAWAACAGFMLQQLWREEASRATRKRVSKDKDSKEETLVFRAFTRRELLAGTLRSEHDIQELLKDPKSGYRARDYWNSAIKELKKKGVIGYYLEGKEPPCNDWREGWLDQPLYIRPKGARLEAALEISRKARSARSRGQSTKHTKQTS